MTDIHTCNPWCVRPECVAQRENYEERAAIMEYEGGLSRLDAERLAREIVYGKGGSND